MFLSEFRSPVSYDIGCDIVGIVAPVALVRRSILIIIFCTGCAEVTGLHRRKTQLGGTDSFERHVSGDFEHVANRSEFDGCRGDGVKLVVLLIGFIIMPCCVAGSCTGEGCCAVFVQRDENGLCTYLELTLDDI